MISTDARQSVYTSRAEDLDEQIRRLARNTAAAQRDLALLRRERKALNRIQKLKGETNGSN